MDWQLLGLTSLLVTAGLIVGVVVVLGLTRTENVLGAGYFVGIVARIVILDVYILPDAPASTSTASVDSWLARMEVAHRAADCASWYCVAVATAFYVVAVLHIWRERSTIWKNVWVRT